MSADDILYSPVLNWRSVCYEIAVWIDANRVNARNIYLLTRPRPSGALYLIEFVEAFHTCGQTVFWRIQYPDIYEFEFDGTIRKFDPDRGLAYPGFGEVGSSMLRSIEDHNLVPNTYTSFYVFRTPTEAADALTFVAAHNKP